MVPAAKGFSPRGGCSPSQAGCATQGLQEERQSHRALHGPFLALIPSISTAVLSHSLCPSRSCGGSGWPWGSLGCSSGVLPPRSPQLCPLGCLCCIRWVSKPPSCPRNNHNLLCVFLAQKRLIHSLKQINYFCYLEKKKKKRDKSFRIGRLNFQLRARCSEANLLWATAKKFTRSKKPGLQYLPAMSAVRSVIYKVFVNASSSWLIWQMVQMWACREGELGNKCFYSLIHFITCFLSGLCHANVAASSLSSSHLKPGWAAPFSLGRLLSILPGCAHLFMHWWAVVPHFRTSCPIVMSYFIFTQSWGFFCKPGDKFWVLLFPLLEMDGTSINITKP